jgi:hypothetical protein
MDGIRFEASIIEKNKYSVGLKIPKEFAPYFEDKKFTAEIGTTGSSTPIIRLKLTSAGLLEVKDYGKAGYWLELNGKEIHHLKTTPKDTIEVQGIFDNTEFLINRISKKEREEDISKNLKRTWCQKK